MITSHNIEPQEPQTSEEKKKVAIQLIDSIMFVADETERERTELKKALNPRYRPVGESSIQFHLKVLKELVEGI